MAGNPFNVNGKPLVINRGEKVVLLRAAQRASQRKGYRALTAKERSLSNRTGAPRLVPVKAEGRSRMSDNTVEREGNNGVSGRAVHITSSISAKGPYGRELWRDCLATMVFVTAVGTLSGGTSRKTVLERETVEKEPQNIT